MALRRSIATAVPEAAFQESPLLCRIRQVVCDCLGLSSTQLDPYTSLIHDLGVDSLDLGSLAVGIESAFEIPVEASDHVYMTRLYDIASYVQWRMLEREQGLL